MLEEITNNLKEKLVIVFFILLEAQKFYMIEKLST